MSKVWLALLLVGSALSAETLGNIEYRTPSENWELAGNMENERGITHVYLPKNSTNESHQVFTAHSNTLPQNNLNEATILNTLQKLFPGAEVEVKVLSKNKESIIYQWDTPVVHGLTRVFITPSGTSILTYQTESPEHIQGAFLKHLVQTLQDAHVVN